MYRRSNLLAGSGLLLLLAGSLAACRREKHADIELAQTQTPDAASSTTSSQALSTTSPVIALANLDAEIADGERRAKDPRSRMRGVLALLTRGQFLGRIVDLEKAYAASEAEALSRPTDPETLLLRAHTESALHRFAAANQDVDRALALHASGESVARARVPILLAQGQCERAAALVGELEQGPSLTLATNAALEQRRGHVDASKRLFALARSRFRDVSPFGLAFMDFEHARALERQGDTQGAREALVEATTALPSYAHAAVHLAALESGARALLVLAPTVGSSDDPTVMAARADALRRASRMDEAAAAEKEARARFEEVLAHHPEAFADHAAAFFLGVGRDVPRALSLARQAAMNAPSEEALDLWLTAAQAVHAASDVCAAVVRANAIECVLGPLVKARFDAARATCQ